MIILDTNVISEPLRKVPEERVLAWLDDQPVETLFLTAVNLAELLSGVAIMPPGKRRDMLHTALANITETLFGPRILSFDQRAAHAFARITSEARAKGLGLGAADAQIAAIAIVNGLSVATRDTTPFTISGVNVIDPRTL